MSYNIYDKTTDTLKKVAGRVANGILNTLSEVKANASENVSAGSLAVKELAEREDYSTEEKVIGTWIDGKPLYRKVVPITTKTSAGWNSVTHNISNLGSVINAYTMVPYTNGYWTSVGAGGTSNMVMIDIDNTNLEVYTNYEKAYGRSCNIVVEYTKTTD